MQHIQRRQDAFQFLTEQQPPSIYLDYGIEMYRIWQCQQWNE
jgi:hypothetical protein